MRACQIQPQSFKAYSIERNGLSHRITFSQDLAEHIISKLPKGYQIRQRKFRLGKRLQPGQDSPTGLYCLATSTCRTPLRISLIKEAAAILSDEESRYIAEAIPQ